mmetsp:Transcript_48023/g.93812  ORF Transcript_48023/g.93812 Transcript_48023/m.93812 type:complete len:133 (-) Transcript_48023:730-1128(-)
MFGPVGKRTKSGSETTGSGDDLTSRVVAIKVFWRIFAVDVGNSKGNVVVDGGDGGAYWERYRFVWWVEILGVQGWGCGRMCIASSRVWDDHEFMARIAVYFGGRVFCGENSCVLEGSDGGGMWRKRVSAIER